MVAVGGLHDAGDLPGLQGQGRLLKGGHHLAHGGGVAVRVGLQAAVLAVGLHQLVELGGEVLRPLELGQQVLRQLLLLRHLLRGQGGVGVAAVLLLGGLRAHVHGEEEDVLGLVGVAVQHLVGGGGEQGVPHVVVIGAGEEQVLHGFIGQAEGVLHQLVVLLAVLLHLVPGGLDLGVGGQAAQLRRLLPQDGVVGGDVGRAVRHHVGVGALLIGVGLVGELEAEHPVLGQEVVAAHTHPVQGQIRADLVVPHRQQGVGAGQPGGEGQHVLGQVHVHSGGGGGIGGHAGGAGGLAPGGLAGEVTGAQGEGQGPGQGQGRETVPMFHFILQS